MALPDFHNTTPAEIEQWAKKLTNAASQYGEVVATLIVNCKPGRKLAKYGCKYSESHSLVWNLIEILEHLTKTAELVVEEEPNMEDKGNATGQKT